MAAKKKSAPKRRGADQTKARFLQATEQVFCAHGYEGTTIRAVATRARANLGTLQHYWGSKRALFRDLFERRFLPLSTEHLRRLQALDAAATARSKPDIREVLKTLVDLTFDPSYVDPPTVPVEKRSGSTGDPLRRLFGRALMDPSSVVITDMNRIFEKPVVLFLDLARRACPNLDAAELDWRLNCVTGAHLFSLVHTERLGRFFGGDAQVADEVAAQWVLDFLLHGFCAPATKVRNQ
jgi:AcrR family transcriptional regulator